MSPFLVRAQPRLVVQGMLAGAVDKRPEPLNGVSIRFLLVVGASLCVRPREKTDPDTFFSAQTSVTVCPERAAR